MEKSSELFSLSHFFFKKDLQPFLIIFRLWGAGCGAEPSLLKIT